MTQKRNPERGFAARISAWCLGSLLLTAALVPGVHAEPADELTVSAKLIEIPSKFPPDDLYDYAYVI